MNEFHSSVKFKKFQPVVNIGYWASNDEEKRHKICLLQFDVIHEAIGFHLKQKESNNCFIVYRF